MDLIVEAFFLYAQNILAGAINGAVVALLGYAKNSTVEKFDKKKAMTTMAIGAVIGGIARAYGMDYQQAETWLGSIGAITVIEYVVKALVRKFQTKKQ